MLQHFILEQTNLTLKQASKYFHIFENAVMKSISHRGIKTGVAFRPEDIVIDEKTSEVDEEKATYKKASKFNRSFLMLLRELMWKLGRWKTPELKAYLDEFNPEVLFCPIGVTSISIR